MKYIVISDSHGLIDEIYLLRKKYSDYIIIHCGDYTISPKVLDKLQIIYVKGNCDTFGESEKIIKNEYNFFITHGDRYNVKMYYDNIYFRAKELNCNYVLFGHTHELFLENVCGIWMINPGSLRNGTFVTIIDGIPKVCYMKEVISSGN